MEVITFSLIEGVILIIFNPKYVITEFVFTLLLKSVKNVLHSSCVKLIILTVSFRKSSMSFVDTKDCIKKLLLKSLNLTLNNDGVVSSIVNI